MKRVTIRQLMLLFPVIFLLHDIEEIITIEYFTLPFGFALSRKEFTAAFLLLWLIVLVGCLVAFVGKRFLWMKPTIFFAWLVAGVFLANGIGHVLQAIYFWSYVPGLLTAVFLLLPFCLFSIVVLYRQGVLTKKQIPLYLLVGFVLQTPFALIALLVGKSLV